jgi:hypothetical protein
MGHVPEAEDDLRATSESILTDAERLASLEERKQRLDPQDPEVLALSVEIETLTVRIRHQATAEREIAEEIQAGS